MKNPTLPIYFIAGAQDPVIVSKEAWLAAVADIQAVGYQEITSKLYEGMRHEIHNEMERQYVYEDLLNFLNA